MYFQWILNMFKLGFKVSKLQYSQVGFLKNVILMLLSSETDYA